MSDNDKPALMSAERLAQCRAMVDGFEPHPAREPVLAAVAALLGHLDALAASDVDAEALGRMVYRALLGDGAPDESEEEGWRIIGEERRAAYRIAGSMPHSVGYARGRVYGGADRARLDSEIARLTAELAEARTVINRAIEASHDAIIAQEQALAAARLDGARQEREAIRTAVATGARVSGERGAQVAFAEVLAMLDARARDEGSPT